MVYIGVNHLYYLTLMPIIGQMTQKMLKRQTKLKGISKLSNVVYNRFFACLTY
jgi:hypothetical protein